MLPRIWLRAFVTLALVAAALLFATPARAIGSTVSPDLGPPGTRFTFVAEGFTPNELVRVSVRTPDGRVIRFTDERGLDIPVFADANGRATWNFAAPTNTPNGLYIAEAVNVSEQIRRRLGFIVQAGSVPTELAAPAPGEGVTVRPEIGPPGTLFVFRATGFQPLEPVSIWLHSPEGSVSDLSADIGGNTEHFTDRNGNLQWVVGTKSNTADGRYVAVAAGAVSGVTRVAAFTVQRGAGQAQPAPTDNITVTPVVGPPGTSFAFTATGFLPNEGIGVWIHRPDGSVSTVSADGKGVKANSIGVATWSITAGTGLPDGVYSMVAQGLVSTQVRVVRFEVRR